MKIAVVTDDQQTVSRHFGRAPYYLVFTFEDDTLAARELRPKMGHQHFAHEPHAHDHDHEHGHEHGTGAHDDHKHGQMIDPITDCAALLSRGMGRGAYLSLEEAHITPVVTDIEDAEAAARAYAAGTIVNHVERLH